MFALINADSGNSHHTFSLKLPDAAWSPESLRGPSTAPSLLRRSGLLRMTGQGVDMPDIHRFDFAGLKTCSTGTIETPDYGQDGGLGAVRNLWL